MLRTHFKVLLFISFLLISVTGICQVPYPKFVNDIGGVGGDSKATGLRVDQQNNIYVAGYFRGDIDLDPSLGVKNFNSNGDADIYVAKYSPTGVLLWGVAMGGNGLDLSNSLAVDLDGNVTITGQFQSSSFDADPGPGVFNISGFGGDDIFVIHLNKDGQFLWAKSIGGTNSERGEDVVTDKSGNVIVGSIFSGPITVNGQAFNTNGGYDGLLIKYDSAGNILWSFSMGATSDDQIRAVSIDGDDNILISGSYFGSFNFNPLGTYTPILGSGGVFVAKYSPSGTLSWAKSVQGGVIDFLSLVTVDAKSNVYISGAFSGTLNFGTSSLNSTGAQDVFIAKYQPNGDLMFSKDIGSAGSAFVYRFTSDLDNNIYCAGYFSGQIDFNPDAQAVGLVSSHGSRDLYLAKYDEDGNYKWAFSAGNADCANTYGIEIAIDKNKNVILGGAFCSTVDFDPSFCAEKALTAQNGTSDSFVAQYSQDANNIAAPKITSFSIPQQIGPTIINAATANIKLTVPLGTNLTALRPALIIPANATVTPASGAIANFTSPVNYVVTNNCIQVTYTVTVKIDNTVPVTDRSACPADAVLLNGDVVATPPSSYFWQVMKTGVWANMLGAGNQPNYTVTAPENLSGGSIAVDYRRGVIAAGNTIYDSYYHLMVTPSTDQNIISVDKQVSCGTESALYNFTGSKPVGFTSLTTYQWQTSIDGTNWRDLDNINTEIWVLNEKLTSKSWFRRVTITGACKAYSNVISIDHIPGPGAATVGPPVTLCNVTSYALTGNIPALDEIGTWSVVSPTSYNPFNAANEHDPHALIVGLPLNSQFHFNWTISKQSCNQTNSAALIIINGVASTITSFSVPGQNAPAVIDQVTRTITLSVSPKVDKTNLIPVVIADNGSLNPLSGTPQNFSGIVNYRLTNECTFVDYKVTISQVTADVLHVCKNENNVLLPATGVTGATYHWERYQNGAWQPAAGSNAGETYIADFAANSAFVVIDSYRRKTTVDGLVTYTSYYDVYSDLPVTNNQITTDNSLICQLGTQLVNLTGSIPSGAASNVNYQWRVSTDNVIWQNIGDATSKDYQFVFTGTVTKYYSRVVISGTCDAVSNIVKIDYAGSVTNAYAGLPQSFCNRGEMTLGANTPRSFEVGTWSVISPINYNPFNDANMHSPVAIISAPPYDVDIELKWSIIQTACNQSSENIVVMHNYSVPVVNAGAGVTIDRGASTVLNGSVSFGNYTFEWSPAVGLSNPAILNPVASPNETTVYTLTAKNGLDCIEQSTVKVVVNNELIIPNTITPNDDGINDVWTIKNIDDHATAEVRIFNKAGQQVFYSRGYGKRWDATYNGKKLPAAVYYYVINLNDIKVTKSGWVTVIY
jgi:gliding motility-associated-like protein